RFISDLSDWAIAVSLDGDFYKACTRNNPGPSAPDIRESGMAIGPGKWTEVGSASLNVTVDLPAPSRFATFTMANFGISDTRSRHEDTDFVFLSVTVGANPPVFAKKSMGDVNNGTHSVGLSIDVDIPDDDTIVVFNYLIMNSGHSDDNTR